MKIDQGIVDQTFMVRNGTCGFFYDQEDVERIKSAIQGSLGVSLSNSEVIDFWRWRSSEWDSGWVTTHGDLDTQEWFQKFIQFVGVEPSEDEEDSSEPPPKSTVKVVVKDAEDEPWEVELDAGYHADLLRELEVQIPEKSAAGTIRYSLVYDPTKVLNCRKLEE